ncbi:MAG: hypothetical protein OHK93_006900 [Ramalina farinacea]|uniref:NmrA-like domain-containing protein n=1 Tax=Ramalina farinacea TaxID=258253 RepID=A0AA43QJH5_9LECA|nr:hypothetical protein [Ramalina farinacea]
MSLPTLLITGATGKQGGAVIDALRQSQLNYKILALTRNASSPAAKQLLSTPNLTLVEGDTTKPAPIFAAHGPIHGVFGVTALGPKNGDEEAQAEPLIDASISNGVNHFVFTSVDRGGPDRSPHNPTEIAHFRMKHRIEEYLTTHAKDSRMTWTVLRPTAFMDNFEPGMPGKVFASMWAGVGDKPLQLISIRDIGLFAVKAFADPERYHEKAISLAGDALTVEQAKEVFRNTMGYDMPVTYRLVGYTAEMVMTEIGKMFRWFKTEGYGADIAGLRREEPRLQDFGTWLRESSGFAKAGAQ